jgi:hypothetical protein
MNENDIQSLEKELMGYRMLVSEFAEYLGMKSYDIVRHFAFWFTNESIDADSLISFRQYYDSVSPKISPASHMIIMKVWESIATKRRRK